MRPRPRRAGVPLTFQTARGALHGRARPPPVQPSDYPARLAVDYPDRDLNRLTTFFRIFMIIPIAIVLATVSGSTQSYSGGAAIEHDTVVIAAGGLLFAGPLLMILFRQKYPRWWFDWNLELTRFTSRVDAVRRAARRRYPSTDEQQARAPRPRLPGRAAATSTAGCRS